MDAGWAREYGDRQTGFRSGLSDSCGKEGTRVMIPVKIPKTFVGNKKSSRGWVIYLEFADSR